MKTFKILPILFALLICITSCSDDDDEDSNGFDGSIESIENFYTPELLEALDEIGYVINEGDTPPIINGTYLANPLILIDSNITDDNIGSTYNDFQMTFANQNNANLNLDFQGLENTTVIESIESFISGSEDDFSVFLKVESTRDDHTAILAYTFTGTLSEEGILNFQFALIMLDDNGDPTGELIANNSGRLFVDGNDLCDVIDPDSRAPDAFGINGLVMKNLPGSSSSF